MILTFLAVHWGVALDPQPAQVLLGLGIALVVDLRAGQAGLMPGWYVTLL